MPRQQKPLTQPISSRASQHKDAISNRIRRSLEKGESASDATVACTDPCEAFPPSQAVPPLCRTMLVDSTLNVDGDGSDALALFIYSMDGSQRGGSRMPDDVVAEILLYIDELDFVHGLKTLLAVSAVSAQWRAVANRLPQWSILVRSTRLPCPSFNRCGFLGSRNAVFRPIIQAQAHRAAEFKGMLFAIFLGAYGLLVSVLILVQISSAILIARDESHRLSSGGHHFAVSRGWDGAPRLCYDYASDTGNYNTKTCVDLERVFNANQTSGYITVGAAAAATNASLSNSPVLEKQLMWMCPRGSQLQELRTAFQWQIAGHFLAVFAAPVIGFSACVHMLTISRYWLRRSVAFCASSGTVLIVSLLLLTIGTWKFTPVTSTPCSPDHPAMEDAPGRWEQAEEYVYATFAMLALLLVIAVATLLHGVALKLWRLVATPEDAEVPPEAVPDQVALALERVIDCLTLFKSAKLIDITFVHKDSGHPVEHDRVARFDQRTLVLHTMGGVVVDVGAGHRITSVQVHLADRIGIVVESGMNCESGAGAS